MDISSKIGGYQVFYTELETDETTNKISSKLKNKTVPNHLKEKFLEQYGKKVREMSITAQEIDYFLEKNKQLWVQIFICTLSTSLKMI